MFHCCNMFLIAKTFIVTGISCEDPGPVDNAVQTGLSYKYQDTVMYNCNTGYLRTGGATITCQDDGTWSSSKPTCTSIFIVQFNTII